MIELTTKKNKSFLNGDHLYVVCLEEEQVDDFDVFYGIYRCFFPLRGHWCFSVCTVATA